GRGGVGVLGLVGEGVEPGERQVHLAGGPDRSPGELPVTPEPLKVRRHGRAHATEPPFQVFDVEEPSLGASVAVAVEDVADALAFQGDFYVAHVTPAPRSAKAMSLPKLLLS